MVDYSNNLNKCIYAAMVVVLVDDMNPFLHIVPFNPSYNKLKIYDSYFHRDLDYNWDTIYILWIEKKGVKFRFGIFSQRN